MSSEEVRISRIMSGDEFQRTNADAMARGLYNTDRHAFPPGSAWYMPWIFDPTGTHERPMIRQPGGCYLSGHYWGVHARARAPICVVCPNGQIWEIDRPSKNGTGWIVSGCLEDGAVTLTCSPSIVVTGYHGFLRNGVFTPDVDGRPRNGIMAPYVPRSPAPPDP